MLYDICDGSQYHMNVNTREACYKIRDNIKQKQWEWKVALKAVQIMGKGLHKVFNTVVKINFEIFTTFGIIWFRSFPFHSRT